MKKCAILFDIDSKNNVKPKAYEDYTEDELIMMCDLAISEHKNNSTIPSDEVEKKFLNIIK